MTYYLRSPSLPQEFISPVDQYIPECGLTCSASASPSTPELLGFDTATGAILVDSGAKGLSSTSQTFTITCSSPNSIYPGGIQTKTITVNYIDECVDATVSKPSIQPAYYEMDLFTVGSASYSLVEPSLNCLVEYQFIPVQEVNPLRQSPNEWSIIAEPMSYSDHMGLFEYMVKACIIFENTIINCQTSNTASVLVSDPCITT